MDISKDLLSALTQLMPGFLTAWVIYGLTTYTKPAQFERIVQALIYSYIISALTQLFKTFSIFVGKCYQLGTWNSSTELVISALLAIALGLVFSYFMTNDKFFTFARRLGITARTVFPSEWYGAFASKPPRYIVLHLTGERRISGYPIEWPSDPNAGHFKLVDAAWLGDKNKEIPLDMDDSVLISAKDVELVEFLKTIQERQNGSKVT